MKAASFTLFALVFLLPYPTAFVMALIVAVVVWGLYALHCVMTP